MNEEKQQHLSHAEQVQRRAFIRKAVLGAVLAVPAIESFTKSDILVKSALAASGKTWTITATWAGSEGSGTALPVTQTVVNGGSATITVTPDARSFWALYAIDDLAPIFISGTEQDGGSRTLTNVTADHVFHVVFGLNL